MTTIGESLQRVDILDKVQGKTVFGADLSFPGMLYARALRSNFPHAKILHVDVERAKRVSGVVTVVTGQEVAQYGLFGMTIKDQPILAVDKVRYIGDPIAAVAAIDEEAAEEALSLIRMEYKELPSIFDPVESMKPHSPLIHENMMDYEHTPVAIPLAGTNICSHFRLLVGDVEEGFSSSDEVFEDTFTTQAQSNCCMEPRMSIAMIDSSGRLMVWSSTQSVYGVLRGLSELFKIPQNKIRVVAPPLGGSFGTKLYLKAEPVAVVLSQRSGGRPVKFQWTREEEFTVPTMRHPSIIHLRTGVKRDGTLIAREVKIIWDTGAYAETGPLVCRNGSFSSPGPYKIPHVKVDGYCVYTNKIVSGAMRGFGLSQPMFAIESQMDIIAERLGIDPMEIRLKNAVEEGSISGSNQKITHTALKKCILEAARVSNWSDRQSLKAGQSSIARGKGIAIMHKGTITPSCSSALARVNGDGTLTLLCSTSEMGQGAHTVLSQIGAETLGVPFDSVNVISSDTDITPYDRSTTSSRSTFHMGNAVRLASLDAKNDLLQIASEYFEASLDELVVEKGIVYPKDRPSDGLSIEQLIKKHFGGAGTILGKGTFLTHGGNLDPNTALGDVFSVFWMYACVIAEVEVDMETGTVKVLEVISANDVGKAINPINCEQQIEGGVLMGLGYALLEELLFEKGKVLNDNFTDYKIPTLTEAPRVIPLLIEKPHPDGPFGAKGIAEEAVVAIAPAIANAVYHATGVRVKTLPITPEKVLRGLKEEGLAR
jgi:CO/xanthine dehydrogenase Mo-binding subunit